MVDIGVTLVDGKEHPVDSSEMAFRLAAKGAMKLAIEKAGPVLLEPYAKLSVYVDNQYLGDILSDLSGKPLPFDGPSSVICASPGVVKENYFPPDA